MFLSACPAMAQLEHSHLDNRNISFPDVPGHVTLVADLHIHTVFSDGSVWPNIRIQEGQKDGLDVISMTEHLEYQPHEEDIPHPDRNRSYEIASKSAKGSELIVVKGSEITRDMPPGHANAIFIEDANKLLLDDPEAVFAEAHRQGAFIFWNHPNWIAQKSDGMATLTRIHKKLIKAGQLNGIEVVNEMTYSKEALKIALDNDLTIIGTSDIHGLVDWQFDLENGGHRPVTLVLAKQRTQESIKEALFAGRTAVWFNDMLIGKKENVIPLVQASIQVEAASYIGDSQVLRAVVVNNSDANYILFNKSDYSFHRHDNVIVLEAQSKTEIEVKSLQYEEQVELEFEVLNAVIAPDKYANIKIQIQVD